jgi:hypothetical protein
MRGLWPRQGTPPGGHLPAVGEKAAQPDLAQA